MDEQYAFLARITRPYGELSDLFNEWSTQCTRMWVYEHIADEKVSRTHCHVIISGSKRDFDNLKKLKSWHKLNIEKGNKGSSSKSYMKTNDPHIYFIVEDLGQTVLQEKDYWFECLKYASKGVVETLKFNYGPLSAEWAENSRKKWDPSREDKSGPCIMNIEVHKTVKSKITMFAMSQMVIALYTEEGLPEEWDRDKDTELIKRCAKICVDCKYLPHYKRVIELTQAVKFQMVPTNMIAVKKCLHLV